MRVAVVGNGPAGSTTVITLKMLRPEITVDYYMRTPEPRAICGGGLGFYAIDKIKKLRAGDIDIGRRIYRNMYESTVAYIFEAVITLVQRNNVEEIRFDVNDFEGLEYLGIVMDRKAFDKLMLLEANVLADNIIIENADPKKLSKKYDIVVDARGMDGTLDYYKMDEMEYVYQWYISPNDNHFHRIDIIFDRNYIKHGYVWIFDSGMRVKVGYGELNKFDAKSIKLKVYRKYVYEKFLKNGGRIDREEGMYLPLLGRIRLFDPPNIFRVGTSAGLIDSLTGAGIRYAIESGFKLAKSIAMVNKPKINTIKMLYRLELSKMIWQLKFLDKVRRKAMNMSDDEWLRVFRALKKYRPKTTNIFREGLKLYLNLFLLH